MSPWRVGSYQLLPYWPTYRRRKRAMFCVANRIEERAFYNQHMLWHQSQRRYPSARWLLAAWLCVLLASMAAPFARAQALTLWEPLCSASGATHWVPSPASEGDAAPLAHGLDCALCLPVLAPPPAVQMHRELAPLNNVLLSDAQSTGPVFSSLLPPVRAPPS